MKILILGHNGMLGHMVQKYLTNLNYDIEITSYRWPSNEFKEFIKIYSGDFIINCIGAIHQRTKDFEINWEVPIYLDFYSKSKVIHPGTDCEIDLDNYGVSKKIAKDFIVNKSKNTKCVTTSIIGPEVNSNFSLMEWFLSQEDGTEVNGYSDYFWNGNTTLTWAKYCEKLINDWDNFEVDTIIQSKCIGKSEILESLRDVFERDIKINLVDEPKFNKCITGDFIETHIKEQIIELKKFYYD
jgi:dTDP-4-dehydrorhamnose reductase